MVLSDDKDNESSLQPTPRPSAFGAAAGVASAAPFWRCGGRARRVCFPPFCAATDAPAASASPRHFALQRTQLILKRLQKLTPSFFEGVSFRKSLND